MRLKEIKPGLVIHCPTEEEAEKLLEYLDGLGYKWHTGKELTSATFYEFNGRNTCYYVEKDFSITFGDTATKEPITKFSDLIIPELTVEEVWSIASEISNMPKDIQKEIFPDFDYSKDNFWNQYTPYEVKRRIEQWKADHEKEEPEVEWYWQGRIFKEDENGCYYQVKDRTGFYDTGCVYRENAEEFMANVLKEYCKTHEGNYIATAEHICRVKAVE